jgi:glycosyltransferase involved in cell wall biosynthesis
MYTVQRIVKQRVLQISNRYAPAIGGTERTCQYLSEGIKDIYDVKVVCFNENKRNETVIINGITVYKAGLFIRVFRQSISFSYINILRNIIKKWNPDIIHFHVPNPFVTLLLLLYIPKEVKLYLHWHLDITTQKCVYPLIKPMERILLRRADMIATTSPNSKYSSMPLRNFMDKVEVLPSAIDTGRLHLTEQDISEIANIQRKVNGKKIILFAGRHVAHKGVLLLLQAIPYIKEDCVIFIAGTGTITPKVKKRIYKTRNVFFLGRVDDNTLKHYYYAADVFAFPSYTRSEAFGLALAEAMYCKAVPVTFTIKGSGVNWVSIANNTCIEVENCNIGQYAKAIDTLLSNDTLRKKYAENGRDRVVKEFTVDNEITILLSHYRRLLANRRDL